MCASFFYLSQLHHIKVSDQICPNHSVVETRGICFSEEPFPVNWSEQIYKILYIFHSKFTIHFTITEDLFVNYNYTAVVKEYTG